MSLEGLTPSLRTRRPNRRAVARAGKEDYGANWTEKGTIAVAILLLSANIFMAVANWGAARAATSAANTAAGQLELSERPWVDAQVSIDGPLTYNVNGANLHVLINMRNTGHSPALNTEISPKLLTTFGGQEPMKIREQLCADASRVSNTMPLGTTLFPDVQFPYHLTVTLSEKEIKDAQELWKGKLGNNAIGLNLVFCIAYRPTFAKATYQTGYILDVINVDKKTNLPNITFPWGEEIDPDHLRIRLGIGSIVAN